jgi:hypothetical protein
MLLIFRYENLFIFNWELNYYAMKKQILMLLFSGLVSLLGMNSTSAQISLREVTISGNLSKTVVNEQVNSSFSRLFKDAEAPQWFEVNKRYVVNFIYNDQRNRAVFTKGGQMVYHLVYANENEMPTDIRSIVKSKYYDYAIISTIMVNQDGRNIWVINVEDKAKILVLRVEGSEMSVIDTIKKT